MTSPEALEIVVHTRGLPIGGEDPVDLPLGGSETAALSMARALSRLGHRVTLSCNTDGIRERDGVELVPAERLVAHREGRMCDLLLAARDVAVLEKPVAARMCGTWHQDMPSDQGARLIRQGLSRAFFCLFISRFQQEAYGAFFPGLSRLGSLTTNGVDFDALEPLRNTAVAGGPHLRFFYASRPDRGLAVLLREIWPALKSRLPEAELLVSSYSMAGVVPPERFAEESRLCNDLIERSPGAREIGPLTRRTFWRELASCTAVLYPTDFPETSCMVALEAQALGVPIVTTGRFALAETVGFHETLIRDPWRSPEYTRSFVATVLRLAEDPGFALRAREAGLRHVRRETHSWDAIAAVWQDLFHRLFRERFARRKAGVLRRLLRDSDLVAARRLVAAETAPEAVFDSRDLAELRQCAVRAASPAVERVDPANESHVDLDRKILRAPPLPAISALLLVKNEEANARRAVASLEAIADEIVIGDTGSTDKTIEIVESMGFVRSDAAPGGDTARRRWVAIAFEDFAQARNALGVHARGDYVLWQDADEVMVHAPALRAAVDGNEYFDGFRIEQRHLSVDSRLEPDHPLRCFRRETEDGPLQWIGCLHETVEHRLNEPPRRTMICPGVYFAHLGFFHAEVRQGKAIDRNWPLFLKDRRENPGRWAGYVVGLREYLLLARWEIGTAGRMTEKAYRDLNYGFEIWHRHVRHLPAAYRRVGFPLSRDILALLAQHKLPLRLTGGVPFQADLSLEIHPGSRAAPVDARPRRWTFFADFAELRTEVEHLLSPLAERCTSMDPALPPSGLAAGGGELRRWTVPPELFDLEPF